MHTTQLGIHQLRTASKERAQAGGCQSSHSGEALGLAWGADNTESIQQTEKAGSNRKE